MPRSPLPHPILYSIVLEPGKADQFILFFLWGRGALFSLIKQLCWFQGVFSSHFNMYSSPCQGVHYLIQSCTVLELGRQINSYSFPHQTIMIVSGSLCIPLQHVFHDFMVGVKHLHYRQTTRHSLTYPIFVGGFYL
jgi:hypothetical protein